MQAREISCTQDPASEPEQAAGLPPRPSATAVDPQAAYGRHCAAIVESSDDVIISKSLDGIVQSWNPAARRLLGYTALEMVGQPMTRIFPEDRLFEEVDIMARIRQGMRVEPFDTVRRSKDGRSVNLSITISPVFDDLGQVIGASTIARDITERFRSRQLMWLQANFDNLTGMPNRRHFTDKLDEVLKDAAARPDNLAVLFLDLDHFKQVNDALGRNAGDQVLATVAARIREALRPADSVACFGSDEFGVMLGHTDSVAEIDQLAAQLMHRLKDVVEIGDEQVFMSCSIGVSVYPRDGSTADDLIRHADLAMYQAKLAGRNRVHHFVPRLEATVQDRLKLAAALHRAVELQQFSLDYQPVIDMRDGRIRKCEALIRWHHPERGLISPAQFISVAEEIGLMHAIGNWVFQEATRQLKRWQALFGSDFQVSINMSPAQLQGDGESAVQWVQELTRTGIQGSSVVVEITESMMVSPDHLKADKLRTLRRAGLQLAIDDFGTGYSCLANLNQLDISYLKIDQSFTRNLKAGTKDLALCQAIVSMAHALGLGVIAEGVETPDQHELLADIGCDFGQGYLYARPMGVAAFEALMDTPAQLALR